MSHAYYSQVIFTCMVAIITRSTVSDVCVTQDCMNAAETLKKSINFSVDPCDDFYEYACGNWMQNNPIPPTDARRSQFNTATERLERNVFDILKNPVSADDDEPLRIVKTFYTSCIDTGAMDSRGLKPLLSLIEKYGGWPLIHGQTSEYRIENLLGSLIRNLQLSAIISVSSGLDMKNTSRRLIMVDQPSFFIERDFLVESDAFQDRITAYSSFVRDVVLDIYPETDQHVLDKKIDNLIDFEIKLANAAASAEKRRNVTALYNPFTVEELQVFIDANSTELKKGKINILELLNHLWNGISEIPKSEELIVLQPNYLTKLARILDETSEETVLNYIHWRWISGLLEETTDKMREVAFSFQKVMRGVQQPENRTKLCGSFEMDSNYYSLGYALAPEYIKRNFPASDKKMVDESVQYLQQAFKDLVGSADWMEEKTKLKALEKLQHMKRHLAYPDWLTNTTAVHDYYRELKVQADLHFENCVNLFQWESLKQLRKLRQQVDQTEADFHPLFVNAFYDPQHNSVNFPAAILVAPFFRANGLSPLNFGAIGVVIGHEITHGFDDQGSNYDAEGNIRNWWDDKTHSKFEDKAKCLMNQYSSFKTEIGNINGRLTCGENIADNGGLRQAYFSHRRWLDEKKVHDVKLAGFENFTADQLFFLGFASVWCQNVRPEVAKQQLMADPHSPGKYRTIGSLQNSQYFAQAWNCPSQVPMNPAEKCVLW